MVIDTNQEVGYQPKIRNPNSETKQVFMGD